MNPYRDERDSRIAELEAVVKRLTKEKKPMEKETKQNIAAGTLLSSLAVVAHMGLCLTPNGPYTLNHPYIAMFVVAALVTVVSAIYLAPEV